MGESGRPERGIGAHAVMARPGVSVVVCCYNSAKVLPETLSHLARQDVPDDISWEVVVVDNASTDQTATIARKVWTERGGHVPFRVVPQPVKGLVAARNKGVEAATFEFVLFCDDDNRLAPDYVRRVWDVLSTESDVGVVGGCGEPDFETTEPAWFHRYPQYYATGPQAETSGDVTETKGYVYGAGFALRRSAWMAILESGFESPLAHYDRGSNDIEVCFLIRLAGARIWYDERMRFRHYLPARRLGWTSFLELAENAHLTGVYLDAYQHVFRAVEDSGAYASPPRWRWLARVARLAPRWLRAWVAARRHRNEEGHVTHVRLRRFRGECLGWLTLRGGFPDLCDRIHRMRGELRDAA